MAVYAVSISVYMQCVYEYIYSVCMAVYAVHISVYMQCVYEYAYLTVTYPYMCIAIFAWMLEEREEPLTIFMWLLLEKISIYNDKVKTEALACTSVLTPPATTEFDKRLLTFKKFPVVINVCGDNKYNVRRTVEYKELKAATYTVDMSVRTCTCQYWPQVGVPCEHAIAVVNHVNGWDSFFTTAYFHRHMLTETRLELLAKHNLSIVLPDDHRIKQNKLQQTFRPLEPVLETIGDLASDVSKKRVASAGEGSKPSNIKSDAKRNRYTCPDCNKDLSKKTDHTPGNKACRNHLKKNDRERYEELYCSSLDARLNALMSLPSNSTDQVSSPADTSSPANTSSPAASAPAITDTSVLDDI